jgi:hypothetical protein
MTMTLNFPKYMRMATLGGIAKIYSETSINVGGGGKILFYFGKCAGKPCI